MRRRVRPSTPATPRAAEAAPPFSGAVNLRAVASGALVPGPEGAEQLLKHRVHVQVAFLAGDAVLVDLQEGTGEPVYVSPVGDMALLVELTAERT